MDDRYGPETVPVRRFLARLEQLSLDDLARVMDAWRAAVLREQWFDADKALGVAFQRTGRYALRLSLLDDLHEVFRRAPWFKPEAPDPRTPGSEATAQYAASMALSALLVRDALSRADLDVLYAPFGALVPMDSLGTPEPARRPGVRA